MKAAAQSGAGAGKSVLLCSPSDSVAIALEPLEPDDVVQVPANSTVLEVRLQGKVPAFHKFSLCRIPQGQVVLKQGEAIGTALREIAPGEHVHVHNLSSLRARTCA